MPAQPKKECTIEFWPKGVPASERQKTRAPAGQQKGKVVATKSAAAAAADTSGMSLAERQQAETARLEDKLRAELAAKAAAKKAKKGPFGF